MQSRTFLPLLLFALLSQACVIDVDHDHRHHYDRPTPRQPGRWGDACVADYQCAAGLVCFSGSCEPERLGIYVHGALIAPGLADGREWDSDYDLPRSLWVELGDARRSGVDALFDFMDWVARSGVSAPDVFGFGYLAIDDRWDERLTIDLGPTRRDSFAAIWSRPSGWTDVPLHEGLWVGVALFDEDLDGDESIGEVTIDAWGIREALHRGGVVWFDTYDTTDGQLLLLGLEVISESW